jgi:hypothetical protein
LRTVGLAALLCQPATASSAALPDRDLSPLIATMGLPRADEGAQLAPAGRLRWRSSIATASHAVQDTHGAETMLFDGETTRLAIAFDYGLTDRLQLGIELPYLLHESGGLDTLVETWHDLFGLPNGLRDFVAQDQLDIRYRDAGIDRLDVQSNQRGLGDLRLLAAWQLRSDARAKTAARLSLQLPTGDSDRLTGSGAATLSLGIASDREQLFGEPAWSSFYRAHIVLRDRPDQLPERARRVVGLLAGGISLRVHPRTELTVQSTLRSAAYDSGLRLLGSTALQLSVGGTIDLSDTLRLAIAVGEDVRVKTAPDVSFAVALHFVPPAR